MGVIGDWGSGSTPNKGILSYYGGNNLWLRTGELNDGVVSDTEIKITDKALSECSFRHNTKGDVLIAMYGATIGKVSIAGADMVTNQACCGCTPFLLYNKYLFYFLMASRLDLTKKGEGGAQPNISREKLVKYLIPIPSLKEQYRIVEKIEEILPYIERFTTEQSNLDSLYDKIKQLLKKSLLQEAIKGKLVPQCSEDEPTSVLLQRIKVEKERLIKEKKIKRDKSESVIFRGDDNRYFEKLSDGTVQRLEIPFVIPESWEWVRLGDLVYNLSGLSYKKEDLEVKDENPIRVLRGGNISDGKWVVKDDDVRIAPQFVKPDLLLKAGTFITPAVSSLEQVGKTGLIEKDLTDTVVGGFVLMMIPFFREASLIRYLLYLFQSPFYKSLCQAMVNKSGQAFYNLSRTKLMNAAIPLPPIEEQLRIARYLDEIFIFLR